MSDITVNINGQECKAKEGEYILNIARREGIFIPAICYLTGCSPTLACRVCLVEADGKRVYSCNAKVKDGMNVVTDNDEISEERRAIMEVYDVNHPLQCGVCDQSGECELQNYTLYMNVDSQSYAVRDTNRSASEWGVMKYDPGLCIVCEKCVTVCKDMIGSFALKTVKRGGDVVEKGLKETMPKDAYAMWNKLQKSLIGYNEDNCIDCGECIAVCPVGALVSKDFQYTSNAWELRRIPASNPHSSDCSLLYYEVKHTSVDNAGKRIYRVTNDPHYVSLNGASRFGYDFENRVQGKDKALFDKAVDYLKNSADTIKFTSFITNEEALILQRLKEKYGYKLINNDALNYKKFLKAYSSVSGNSLYSGDLKKIKNSNFIVSVGTSFRYDAPAVGYAVNNALTINKGAMLYFHPIKDRMVEGYTKSLLSINHKAGAEENVLAFILELFADVDSLPEGAKKLIDSIDKENLELPEDFDTQMDKFLKKKDTFSLVVGEDLYTHDKSENLAKIVALIDKYTNFDVTIIPSQTNTLGVSLICDLDEEAGQNIAGYNEKADFTLSALGNGDLDMPALNQQEGTFTNIDKRVVPTNAAIEYNGYCLNDLASKLGLVKKYTIDYAKELPVSNGFSPLEFDLMPNFFDNGGNELRGYLLENKEIDSSDEVDAIGDIELLENVVYRSNPINQFSPFTNKAHELNTTGSLYVSNEFLTENGLSEGDVVEIDNSKDSLKIKVELDSQIHGLVPYLPTFDQELDFEKIFNSGYRFAKVNIKKV